jgi:dTDP-4-amino-4,6-dideoxygalactose transaminase
MAEQLPLYFCTQFLGAEEKQAVAKVLDSDWVTTVGPAQEEFEESFSHYFGGGLRSLALCSGTAAIELFYESLQLVPGDVVICSSLTFVASVSPAARRGASICFIDSEASTWSMCPDLLAEALISLRKKRKRVRAVCLPYIYGQPAATPRIAKICKEAGVPLFEDAAEGLGTRISGSLAGTFGYASAFSFNGNKMITTGGGGMLCSGKKKFIEASRMLAFQAKAPGSFDYQHFALGFNFRLSNVLAAIGCEQLKKLPHFLNRKREIHEFYRTWARRTGLCDLLHSDGEAGTEGSYWLNVISIDGGAKWRLPLVESLAKEKIQSRPVWFPLHRQKIFSKSMVFGGDFAVKAHKESLCLPSGLSLTDDDLALVTKTLERFLKGKPRPKGSRKHPRDNRSPESSVVL